jgi:16S rRNA (cytidine1402-2'-O)-methyltransferase
MDKALYLIPNVLAEGTEADVLPSRVVAAAHSARVFFVEDLRAARRLLARLKHPVPMDELRFYELNEHTPESVLPTYLPILTGGVSGVISEAGLPAVADPGAALVRMAHEHDVRVVPLSGPSSLLMALAASGMNGQCFAFNGYLPVKQPARIARIRELERRSAQERQTQIFIETPYRNRALLADLLAACQPETRLCIAANITAPDEFIATRSISRWRKQPPEPGKQPTVWLLESLPAAGKPKERRKSDVGIPVEKSNKSRNFTRK